jgi:hypothetical protein
VSSSIVTTFLQCIGSVRHQASDRIAEHAVGSPPKAPSRNLGAGVWMCTAFCVALILAAVILLSMGTGEKGTIMALRLTARLSFLLFWLAYAGPAMAKLFGSTFAILARHGRDFGLAFAAALLVHVGLIVWLFYVTTGHRPDFTDRFIQFECIGLVWVYVLAAFSIGRLRAALDPYVLRIVYAVGLEYIALVFFSNFVVNEILYGVQHPIDYFEFSVSYLPFVVAIVLAPSLRWTAMARSPARI